MARITTMILVAAAVFITPLRLPAASCVFSNAPSSQPCKAHCCANMTCCAVSHENTGPISQPLASSDHGNQLFAQPFAFSSVAVITPDFEIQFHTSLRASEVSHSPAPLALSCIQLI